MRLAFGVLVALVVMLPLRAAEGLTGRILDPVACTKDPAQKYALYVPSAYTPDKKWPVIYCFDPGARGRTPVERLQAAAEKYGYIVAGSLNSRNGPWADNAAAIQAVMFDVESHLAIDQKRIYTAGLSGGARVATQLALAGLAKGVIACSAGFPAMDGEIPVDLPFVFFGTAGSEDFNHGELVRLDEALTWRKAAHRIVFFKGGHEWASAALLTEAVEWLELQAMKSGTRAKDAAFIAAQRQTRLAALPPQPGLMRWRGLTSLAADLKGLADVAELEKNAKELGASREVKDELKAERALQRRENDLLGDIGEFTEGGSVAQMKKRVADLKALAAAPEDSEERRMARRVMGSLSSAGRELTKAMFEAGEYSVAATLLELQLEVRPGQSRTLYDLARARAGTNDRKAALETLTRAAEAGFSDAPRVEGEKLFAKLRGEAAYQAALAKIKSNPPEPIGRGRGGER